MIGIYKITNMVNGHAYIGQSVDIKRRWRNERSRAFQPGSKEYDSVLAQAFRKYGIENFQFTILEECSPQQLDEREVYWIQCYDTYHNGYNQTLGSQQNLVLEEPSFVQEIRNELLTTKTSMNILAQQYNVSLGTVGSINTGKAWYSEQYNYPLRDVHTKTPSQREYAVNLSKDEFIALIQQYHGNMSAVARELGVTRGALTRPVREYQLDALINEIRHPITNIDIDESVVDDEGNVFKSPAEANRYYHCAHVREVCNGKRKTAGGHRFYWNKDKK